MNSVFSKTSLFLAVSVVPLFSFAQQGSLAEPQVQMGNSSSAGVSHADGAYQKNSMEVMLEEAGLTQDMSESELRLIRDKGHVIFKYLYEQQQLEELRGLLKNEERGRQVDRMKEEQFPLTPEEIRVLRKVASSVEKANNSPLEGPVEFAIKTIDIDVDAPKPIQIMVAKGYSSSIMFFDQNGSPWPIEGDIIGDAESFQSTPVEGKPHVGVFEIKRAFSESNALVNLKDLDVPIVIRLTGNESVVDARISVRIPKFGPETKVSPYMSREIENSDPDMLAALNGDKLSNAKSYHLNGVPGTVWYKNNMLYIRTRANLISPPWKGHSGSPSGYHVWKVPPVTDLLFTVDGEMVNATIEKSFDVKIRQQNSIFSD